jgi:nitroreductase
LGLASAWVSAASSAEPQRKIKEILGIPEVLRIYDMMAVGYGSRSPIPKVIRNKEDIVHYDDTGHYRTDAQVIADAEKTRAWCISAH